MLNVLFQLYNCNTKDILSNFCFDAVCLTISTNALSNTGGYIDKLQCLTELFVHLAEFLSGATFDKILKIIFRNVCQEDFTIKDYFTKQKYFHENTRA